MKAKELVVPAVVLVGGYLVVTKVLNLIPNAPDLGGVFKPISDFFGGLFGGTVKGYLVFTKQVVRQGERMSIGVSGLVPGKQFVYGWKELGWSEPHTAPANGEWLYEIYIAYSTPPGVYTVYIDQRMNGGPYGERRLTVTA